MTRRPPLALASVVLVAIVAGCSDDPTDPPGTTLDPGTSVTVEPDPTEPDAIEPGATDPATAPGGTGELGSIDGPASVDPSFDPLGSAVPSGTGG